MTNTLASNITIGDLLVNHQKPLGSGQYGSIFEGLFQNKTKVAVTCVNQKEFGVDIEALKGTQNHKNILQCFCIEDSLLSSLQ